MGDQTGTLQMVLQPSLRAQCIRDMAKAIASSVFRAPVEPRGKWLKRAEAALDASLDRITAEGYDCMDHSSKDLWLALCGDE